MILSLDIKKETSPLLRLGYPPHVALDLLLGAPPTYPSEETSFMDGPLVFGTELTKLTQVSKWVMSSALTYKHRIFS